MPLSAETLDTRIIANVLQLVRNRCPEGIKLMDILLEYKLRFGVYLNVIKMGFKSIYEFCERVRQHCHNSLAIADIRTHHLKCERIFFDEKQYLIWIRNEQNTRNFWLIELLVSSRLPEDIVYQGSCNPLHKLVLPENTFHPQFIKFSLAKIVYVVSPYEIYLHLRGPHYDIAYKRLRQSLRFYDAYYGNSDEKYLMPSELAIPDYYCVVRNPEDHYSWHRARIISNDNGIVSLFAIDYGNTIYDTVDELRLIKMEFFQYPPLAIRVSLTGIEPKCGVWSDSATTFIRKFIGRFSQEHYLVCTFLQQMADNSYSILIGDAVYQENKVVFIHEELVRRDLAIVSDPDSIPVKYETISYDYSDANGNFKNKDNTTERCFKYELNNINKNNRQLKSIVNEVKQISVTTINDNVISATIHDNNTGVVMFDNRKKYFPIEQKFVLKNMYRSVDKCSKKVYQETKYFPIEKVNHHKKKYFPMESVIDTNKKYLSKELLLPVERRRRYLSLNDKVCDCSHIFAAKK